MLTNCIPSQKASIIYSSGWL